MQSLDSNWYIYEIWNTNTTLAIKTWRLSLIAFVRQRVRSLRKTETPWNSSSLETFNPNLGAQWHVLSYFLTSLEKSRGELLLKVKHTVSVWLEERARLITVVSNVLKGAQLAGDFLNRQKRGFWCCTQRNCLLSMERFTMHSYFYFTKKTLSLFSLSTSVCVLRWCSESMR